MTQPQTQPPPSPNKVEALEGLNRPTTAHEARAVSTTIEGALHAVLSFCVHRPANTKRTDCNTLRAMFFQGHTTPASSITDRNVIQSARRDLRSAASAQLISNCLQVHSLREDDPDRRSAVKEVALTLTTTASFLRGAARVKLFQAQLTGTLAKI